MSKSGGSLGSRRGGSAFASCRVSGSQCLDLPVMCGWEADSVLAAGTPLLQV